MSTSSSSLSRSLVTVLEGMLLLIRAFWVKQTKCIEFPLLFSRLRIHCPLEVKYCLLCDFEQSKGLNNKAFFCACCPHHLPILLSNLFTQPPKNSTLEFHEIKTIKNLDSPLRHCLIIFLWILRRDFDSLLYLCEKAFQFCPLAVYSRLTTGVVFPCYVVSLLAVLFLLAYTVFMNWR